MAENMIQGEENTLTITVTDADGTAVDVSGATITMFGKRQLGDGTVYLFEKADGDFSKNVGSVSNVVSVLLDSTDLNWSGKAYAIVKFVIDANNTKKGVFQIISIESPE